MDLFGIPDLELSEFIAIVISFAALAVSIIFGFSQRKHNRNSVRPISAIKAKDQDGYISVSIQNVGTGPLTIETLRFLDDLSPRSQYSVLYAAMPEISEPWHNSIDCADGWTIQVGTSLTLFYLKSDNVQDKNAVRAALSNITVSLDYKDIYDKKFHDERKLDFFSRHFA